VLFGFLGFRFLANDFRKSPKVADNKGKYSMTWKNS